MTLRLWPAPKSASKLSWPLAATLILTLALSLAVSPEAASAQKLRRDEAGNQYGPGLDKLGARTTKRKIAALDCPEMTLELNISTPYGTGIDLFDKAMARKHALDVGKLERDFLNDNAGGCQEVFTSNTETTVDRTFEAYHPGGGSLSIVYNVTVFNAGAAHPTHEFEVLNLNFETGQEVAVSDLFLSPPGASEGLKDLWAMIASGWCRYSQQKTIPSFYQMPDGTEWCANPAMIPLPKRLRERPSLKDLGNAFLTAGGLELRLQPYDAWSYADGPAFLVLDKPSLLRAGFNPALWAR
ncbi:MAG: hypothetical protein LBE49_04480 [Deltaproteobacteria bacterium]|jgi:hypothetical protein|nr:hypothetical protein [Deltaproteobacteria bacterium]